MAAVQRVLLLDDGELDDVVALLDNLKIEFTRLRGGELRTDVAPPLDLVIATPRRAPSVQPGSPAGAKPGRPVRVIVTEGDSTSMRQMLRRAGYDLLVRRPTHPEVWRLLIQRAMYQGDERRRDTRLPLASDVQLANAGADQLALLLDISRRGCHIVSSEALATGDHVAVSIPTSPADGMSLELMGQVIRCDATPGEDARFSSALAFDSLPDESTKRLALLLESVAKEPDSLASTAAAAVSPPAEPAVALQDTSAEGTVAANLEVCVRSERRQDPRGSYPQSVLAEDGDRTKVLMGRDLSISGMRIERLPGLEIGDRFALAIYGPSRPEPVRINAVVCRDDNDEGLGLRFEKLCEESGQLLEKLVASLPDVESLDRSESESMGAVLGEIVD
jgi:hypothetical protein